MSYTKELGIILTVLSGLADAALPFQKLVLSPQFIGEGPSVGDFNKDGKPDMAAGPFWWQGPDFAVRRKYSAEGQESYPSTTYAYHYMSLPALALPPNRRFRAL